MTKHRIYVRVGKEWFLCPKAYDTEQEADTNAVKLGNALDSIGANWTTVVKADGANTSIAAVDRLAAQHGY